MVRAEREPLSELPRRATEAAWSLDKEAALAEFVWTRQCAPIEGSDVETLVYDVGPCFQEIAVSAATYDQAWQLLLAVAVACGSASPSPHEVRSAVAQLVADALELRFGRANKPEGSSPVVAGRVASVIVEGTALFLRLREPRYEGNVIGAHGWSMCFEPLASRVEKDLEAALSHEPVPGTTSFVSIVEAPQLAPRCWPRAALVGCVGALLGVILVTASLSAALVVAGLSALCGYVSALKRSSVVSLRNAGVTKLASTSSAQSLPYDTLLAAGGRSPPRCWETGAESSPEAARDESDRPAFSWSMFSSGLVHIRDGLSPEERRQGARDLARGLRAMDDAASCDQLGESDAAIVFPLGDLSESQPNAVLGAIALASLAALTDTLSGGGAVDNLVPQCVEVRGNRGCSVTLGGQSSCFVM